jgi:hypothetical protein
VRALPATPWLRVDVLVGFALCLAPVFLLAWSLVRAPFRDRVLWVLVLGGAALGFLLSWAGWAIPAVPFKVAAAVAAGRLLGRQMAEGWWLALVAVVALLADIWSVFAGPTRVIVEKAPGVLEYLLIYFPSLGNSSGGLGLGMSDLFFVGLFLTGSLITGLRTRATFWAMAAAFVATVALALLTGRPLPALPFLSLAVLAVNADLLWRSARDAWRARRQAQR